MLRCVDEAVLHTRAAGTPPVKVISVPSTLRRSVAADWGVQGRCEGWECGGEISMCVVMFKITALFKMWKNLYKKVGRNNRPCRRVHHTSSQRSRKAR